MPTLTEEVANLVTSTDALTQNVIDKIGQIDSELDAKKTEIDGYWTTKSAEIDGYWSNKETEITQRLADFDNLVFYAAPTQAGTADGLSSANATTLQDIVENKLVNSVVNKIYLLGGLHVLNSGTTIENYFILQFLPDGVYDALNPPIIITPSTTDSDISRDEIGNPSPSQTCTAHDSDEYPLLIKNSMVMFENIRFRGTRHALRLESSTAVITGESHFDVWIFSISCTAHRGVGLYCVDSRVYGSGQWHINMYHPDYTACSDILSNYAAPIVCERSGIFLHGRLEWAGNIPVAELPTENIAKYRATVESSPRTCINARDRSLIQIKNFAYKGCAQLFYTENQSVIDVQYVEAIVGTEPVKWVGQALDHSKISLSNKFDDWPTDVQKKFKVENTGNVTENASFIANIKSEIFLEGIEVIGTCACSTFALLDKDSEFYAENSIISSDDRDGNLGFFKILQNFNSKAFVKNSVMSTRNGDNDTAITTISGKTISENNVITSTIPYYQNNFGILIKDGVVHGNVSFNEHTHFSIPGDFSSLSDALDFLSDKTWPSDNYYKYVYIDFSEGEHTFSERINILNKQNLIIRGVEPVVKNIISVTVNGGSAGNYDISLQLNSVEGLQVGFYVLIESDGVAGSFPAKGVTGTGDFRSLSGCYEITAIAGNFINIKHTCQKSTFPVMDITSGYLSFFPTLLSFNVPDGSGIFCGASNVILRDLCIAGNETYTHWSTPTGVNNHNSQILLDHLGIVKFQNGIMSSSGASSTNMNYCCVSNSNNGLFTIYNSIASMYGCVLNGNLMVGLNARHLSKCAMTYSIIKSNDLDISATEASSVHYYRSESENLSPILNTVGNGNSIITT